MSPLPQTVSALFGAAVLGVVSAAVVYVVEHYRQEKRRHGMAQDLARLDSELSSVRRELDKLLQQQSERSSKLKRVRRSTKANSVITSTTSEFMSANDLESSDLEFYDVSDDEDEMDQSTSSTLEKTLKEIDHKLDTSSNLEECLERLQDLCIEHPENAQLLWRIGKCHHKLFESLREEERELKKNHLEKGIEACTAALKLNNNSADGHKWMAVLVGSRSDFQSTKERIQDGQLFKHHVDVAISLEPNDAALRHMVGRFCYEVAGLKWFERKVAATLYSEPPRATYEEALEHFLEADKLADYDWKENRLCAAKCYIALGRYKEGVEWLDKAAKNKQGDTVDDKVDKEVKTLLVKYESYR